MTNPTHEEVQAELDKLDGTPEAVLAMLTGLTVDEVNECGGLDSSAPL